MPLSIKELPIAVFSAVTFAVFFGVIALYNWSEYRFKQQLERNGVQTSAQITHVQYVQQSRESFEIELEYVFRVDGVIFTNKTDARIERPSGWTIGETVGVRYLPEDPNKSEIIGNEASPKLILIILTAGVGLFLSIFSPWWFLSHEYPDTGELRDYPAY